jgi:small subunit ribosomal protein S9
MTINGKKADDFLPTLSARMSVIQPFVITDTRNHYDARVTVIGGGTNGQAEAIRHGLARALVVANAELRPALKKAGLLRRDARMVERKKYGKHGARRSTQFSKR